MDLYTSLPKHGGTSNGEKVTLSPSVSLDARVKDWPMMQQVTPTVLIVICYVLAIVFGRQLMKNYKPFELRNFMLVYNFVQVVLCAYITYEVRLTGDEQLTSTLGNFRPATFGFANDIVSPVSPWITLTDATLSE